MADSTISQLPSALTISPVDFFAIDQGGVTKKATLALLGSNVVFVAAGKVFTVNNTLTLAGTDGTTMTFPSTNASLARIDAAQSFAGLQTFTNGVTTPAQLASTVATGTPPLVVASTTPVANLSIGGNAATVTTNANLTGMVTSVGNATTVVTNANLAGEVTSVGNATTVLNATVIGKVLTGFVSGAGVVAATDTILQAIDKLDGNVAARALLAGSVSQPFSASVINVASDTGNSSTTTLGRNAAGGTKIYSFTGSVYDFELVNPAATISIMHVLTGTSNIVFAGTVLSSSPTGGIGYTTGAGGTVTQLTSKSTLVSLNTASGQIIMNNAALASGAIVQFQFNNSICGQHDGILLTFESGGAAINYNLWAQNAAGTIYIQLHNISAGSLSDAIVFNYQLIKGSIN